MKYVRLAALAGALVAALLYVHDVFASRNSSGTMSGISGPYTPGSVISSSVINARLADIEAELTDSKSRSGKGDFTAPARVADGVVTAPAVSWTSETGSGLYRIGSSNVGFAINQAKVGEWTANGYLSANGAVATPSLSFSNDTGSGLYRIGSNNIGFAINGSKRQEWTTTGSIVTGTLSSTGTLSATDVVSNSISGTATTNVATFFEPALANGNWSRVWTGLSTSANAGGFLSFKPNATAANSATCIATAGQNDSLCVNGNNNTAVAGTLTTTGTTTSTGGMTVGATGTATTQINFGTCTTSGGTPSSCTATVAAGAKCVSAQVNTVNDSQTGSVSISGTTLTIVTTNGTTKTFNYVCF